MVTPLTRPPGPRPEQFATGPCSAPSWAVDPHSAPGFFPQIRSDFSGWCIPSLLHQDSKAWERRRERKPERLRRGSVIPVTNNWGSCSGTGKRRGSDGAVREQQSLILVVISPSDVKPVLADEARIWPSAQPPLVIGEGAPEHSDCQQNCSQSGSTVCSRLFFFLPLTRISYFSFR